MSLDLEQIFKLAAEHVCVPAHFAHAGIAVSESAKQHYVVDHSRPVVLSETISEDQIDAELQALEDARKKSVQEIRGMDLQGLNEAYLMFLGETSDGQPAESELLRRAVVEIRNLHAAPAALRIAFREIENQFSKIDMPHIRGFINDVDAISEWLVRNLLEIPHPDLSIAPNKAMIIADRLSPVDVFRIEDKEPSGLVLHEGSPSGHVGDWSAGKKVPAAFVYTHEHFKQIQDAKSLILDGPNSRIIVNPTRQLTSAFKKLGGLIVERDEQLWSLKDEDSITKDGVHVPIYGTIGTASEIPKLREKGVNAIALYRTEYCLASNHVPTENEQYKTYKEVLDYAKGMDFVTFRTFDFEGDKFETDLPLDEKLAHLKRQTRAIMRAQAESDVPVIIKLPNVRDIQEITDYHETMKACQAKLREEGVNVKDTLPKLKIMVEVPSIAQRLDRVKDLYDQGIICGVSIGTNDLPANYFHVQRNNPAQQHLLYPYSEDFIDLFGYVLGKCNKMDMPVTACGALAASDMYAPILMAQGQVSLSTPHGSVLSIKNAVRTSSQTEGRQLIENLKNATTRSDKDQVIEAYCVPRNIGLIGALKNGNVANNAPKKPTSAGTEQAPGP